MKYVHTLGTGRHKRQADITLLFQYTSALSGTAYFALSYAAGYAVLAANRLHSLKPSKVT